MASSQPAKIAPDPGRGASAGTATLARGEVLAAGTFWSTGGLFIKEIGAGALPITFFRCLFSALWLAPFVRGRVFPRPRDLAVAVVLFAALLGLFVASVKETTAANAIFLQYTAPIYVIALAPWLLSERLRPRDLPVLVICLGGVAVLFAGNRGSGDLLGLAFGLGSGFFDGLFILWLRRLRYADPVATTFANCLGVAVLLAPLPFVWDVGVGDLGLLVLMGGVQFALPYVLFTRGLHGVSSVEASLLALIEPVLTPVWVALFLDEEPSEATLIGGAMILLGLVLRYTLLRTRTFPEPGEALGDVPIGISSRTRQTSPPNLQ